MSDGGEHAKIAAIIEVLRSDGRPDLAAWLADTTLTRAQAREARFRDRDAAIVAAMAIYGDSGRTGTARDLAEALARYAATAWRNELDLDTLDAGADDRRRALHAILRRNDGKPLSWRQLLNIADGSRTPIR